MQPDDEQEVTQWSVDVASIVKRNLDAIKKANPNPATCNEEVRRYVLGRMIPQGWKIQFLEAIRFARQFGAMGEGEERLCQEHLEAITRLDEGLSRLIAEGHHAD